MQQAQLGKLEQQELMVAPGQRDQLEPAVQLGLQALQEQMEQQGSQVQVGQAAQLEQQEPLEELDGQGQPGPLVQLGRPDRMVRRVPPVLWEPTELQGPRVQLVLKVQQE